MPAISTTRVGKAIVGLNGLMTTLESLLKSWHPEAMPSEAGYSDALATYLRMSLPEDTRVEREYRHGGTTTDVGVLYTGIISNDQVFFELKRNLKKKTDYDRLVGQVEGLKPRKNKLIVVLVGDTDDALLGRLREHCKEYTSDFGDRMRLLVVK